MKGGVNVAKVEINPKILKWAADRVGGIQVLESRFPRLNDWINNKSQPTFKQLETFAKATATPIGYFFLSEPPQEKLTIPHYRTISTRSTDQPSADLLETIRTMERRQEWMRDYLIDLGSEPLSFIGTAKLSDDPKQVAANIKEKLGLKDGWAAERGTWEDALRNLIARIEDIGILIMVSGIVGNNTHRKLNVNEFRGFVLIDEYAPLIFINGADGKAAQMFTLAHELAHIWYGVSAIFDLEQLQPSVDKIEQACNQTAAEFLVPEQEFLNHWKLHHKDTNRYQTIARKFKVSELVVVRRAADLRLIPQQEYFEYDRNNKDEWNNKSSDGGNFYSTQTLRVGRRFSQAVISNVKSGKLLYRDAYRLTGLTNNTFEEFVNRQEGAFYE